MAVNKVTDPEINPALYAGELIQFEGEEFNATFTKAGGLYLSDGVSWKEISTSVTPLTPGVLYVNVDNGNDLTAISGDVNHPYQTIDAAAIVAVAGNTIKCAPGSYNTSNSFKADIIYDLGNAVINGYFLLDDTLVGSKINVIGNAIINVQFLVIATLTNFEVNIQCNEINVGYQGIIGGHNGCVFNVKANKFQNSYGNSVALLQGDYATNTVYNIDCDYVRYSYGHRFKFSNNVVVNHYGKLIENRAEYVYSAITKKSTGAVNLVYNFFNKSIIKTAGSQRGQFSFEMSEDSTINMYADVVDLVSDFVCLQDKGILNLYGKYTFCSVFYVRNLGGNATLNIHNDVIRVAGAQNNASDTAINCAGILTISGKVTQPSLALNNAALIVLSSGGSILELNAAKLVCGSSTFSIDSTVALNVVSYGKSYATNIPSSNITIITPTELPLAYTALT